MVKRDCELAVKTGAKVDIQHISSGVAVDYVKEAKEKVRMFTQRRLHTISR